MGWAGVASGQGTTSVGDITRDAMLNLEGPGDAGQVLWWMPVEVVVALAQSSAQTTDADMSLLRELCRDYSILGFVCYTVGDDMAIRFRPAAEVLQVLEVVDAAGRRHQPLKNPPSDLGFFLGMLKAMFRQALGNMGENFEFAVFSDRLADGSRLADPTRRGRFTVVAPGILDKPAVWRLPMDSLLPPLNCAQCGEPLKHAWKYCPWCGVKLP